VAWPTPGRRRHARREGAEAGAAGGHSPLRNRRPLHAFSD